MKTYTEALIASKLYEKLGAYYVALGDPDNLLEGEWAKENFLVVVRFPCAARANQFWHSERYEKIKLMRKGAGPVQAMVFEELPVPERIQWKK